MVDSNVEVSDDRQKWIQYGCSNKRHLDDIWLHCEFSGGGFPIIANTMGGFRFFNGKEWFKRGHTLKIGYRTFGDDEVMLMDSEFGTEQNAGFLNSIGARGFELSQFTVETGSVDMLESEPEILLSNTAIANVSEDFQRVSNTVRRLSRNMHEDYWSSYIHNMTQIVFHSCTKIKIFIKGRYSPVRPLDVVLFKDQDVGKGDTDEAVSAYSGNYIVSKVARRAFRNNFTTLIHLVRESNNFMQK